MQFDGAFLEVFYTLARADLEAENAKLKGHIKHIGNDALRAENAKLRKELDYFYMYMPTDVKNIVRAALGEKHD